MGHHDRDEPHRDLLGVPRRDPAHARRRRRFDHQHRVDARPAGLRGLRRVRRGQGRARRAHPPDRGRVRADGAGQRDRARIDRHAALPQGDRRAWTTPTRSSRCSRRTIPLQRLGTADDVARHRALPRERRVGVHVGRGHPVRRRPGGVSDERHSSKPRVVVVTGGASGLGEAIVNRFASDGDRVVVADVDEPRARQVADNLTAAGCLAESMTVDVTSEGEVAAMFDAIVERHGRLDVLVCSAAVETRSSVVDCTDDEWQRVLDVNLKGPFLCCKHGIPAIVAQRRRRGRAARLGARRDRLARLRRVLRVEGRARQPRQAGRDRARGRRRARQRRLAVGDRHRAVRARRRAQSDDPDGDDADGRRATRRWSGSAPRPTRSRRRSRSSARPAPRFISGAVIPLDGGMAARRIV